MSTKYYLPISCEIRQLNKIKRFLTTLLQFSADISAEIGMEVKSLILNLVVIKNYLFCFIKIFLL